MYIDIILEKIAIKNNVNCGAALRIFNLNTNILVVDSIFEGNVESTGTVVIGSTNFNIQFQNTSFHRNQVMGNGGAVRLENNNMHVTFSNCTFLFNSVVGDYGGAVYSDLKNDYLTFSSCNFTFNGMNLGADGGGGAIYISQEHNNFAVVDDKTWDHTYTIETEHPYDETTSFTSRILNVADATSVLLVFDQQTSLRVDDIVVVTAGSDPVYYKTGNIPGLDFAGALIPVIGSSVLIELVTTSAESNVDYYGFKLTVYPIFEEHPEEYTSIFSDNLVVGGIGGAITLSYKNLNPVILRTSFTHNTAFQGGAVFVDTVNGGSLMIGCK